LLIAFLVVPQRCQKNQKFEKSLCLCVFAVKNEMKNGVNVTGIPSREELLVSPGVPSAERLEQGPVAYIECVQDIPCNPCEEACPFGAVQVGIPITNLPELDEEKCTGCGLCIALCPGLAIFTVHKNYTETTALVEFPYEYLPVPQKGDIVPCGDKSGNFVTQGKVVKVKCPKSYDRTTVVTVEIPKEHCLEIRTICRLGRSHYE
jgi:Fe-S-cluster-containing hydrogenase component 2